MCRPPALELLGLFGALALGCVHWPLSQPPAPVLPPPAVVAPAIPVPTPPTPSPAVGPAWFRIGDRVVREPELDDWIREDLFQRELSEADSGERWSYRAEAAERMIDALILRREARRRGIPPGRVLEAEIAALGPVTATELLEFFESNRERWPAEVSFEDAAPDVRAYLEGQRPRQARENLRRRARVRFLSNPPNNSAAGDSSGTKRAGPKTSASPPPGSQNVP